MSEHDDEIGRPAEVRSGGGRLQTSGHGRVATLTPPGVQWSRSGVVAPAERPGVPGDAAGVPGTSRFRAGRRGRVREAVWHGRRRGSRGPRPVRPVAVPVVVRPAALPRPAWPAVQLLSSGSRLLVRRVRSGGSGLPLRIRIRRAVAAAGLTVVAAAVVVGLGQLGGVVAQSRVDAGGGPVHVVATTVTVGPEATVWDVARGVAPTASGPQLATLTERIVTANSLTSVQLHPGQVLRVPQG